jgi:hypothetical protein
MGIGQSHDRTPISVPDRLGGPEGAATMRGAVLHGLELPLEDYRTMDERRAITAMLRP